MSETLIVIPARYGSTRFKAKMLETIGGKSVIEHVWRAAIAADCAEVIIATENQLIVDHVEKFGAKAIMTSEDCQSGTDRIYEASKNRTEAFILNLQGDEPFVRPETIRAVANLIEAQDETDIATACYPTFNKEIINNPNAVKAVLTQEKRALYFSRAAIPYKRDLTPDIEKVPYYIHCGIYGYKRAALERFVKTPQSTLEQLEKLEQLRALEQGMIISSVIIDGAGPAIDTPQDLEDAKKYFKNIK